MTFTITKGMAGRKVELIGKYSLDDTKDSNEVIKQMHIDFFNWKKKQQDDSSKYRIASYERHIINSKKFIEIIDFGDYTYFGLIRCTKKEWEMLVNYKSGPINLDV